MKAERGNYDMISIFTMLEIFNLCCSSQRQGGLSEGFHINFQHTFKISLEEPGHQAMVSAPLHILHLITFYISVYVFIILSFTSG